MAKHPLVCLSMLCCALAYFGGSLLPPVSVTADTLEAAADDCNQLTSVVHQGFVIEETSAPDLFVCRSCATLNFAVGGICPSTVDPETGRPTTLPNGRVATRIFDDGIAKNRRDYCTNTVPLGWECLACTTGQTRGALVPPPTADVHISSSCSYLVKHTPEDPAVGFVDLSSPHLRVHAHGGYVVVPSMPADVGRHFLLDEAVVCPVNASLADCDAGETEFASTALQLTADGNLTLNNVSSPLTKALVTVRPVHARQPDVRLDYVSVVGSAQAFTAAFSHAQVSNELNITCVGRNRVLFQTRRGIQTTLGDHPTVGCRDPINVADLLSAYGEHYEIAFNHDGVVKREASQLVKVMTRLLIYVNVALGIVLVFGHEGDVRRLVARHRK